MKYGRLESDAFTLAELIATVAVAAILIAFVSLGVSAAQAGAQRAKCLSNMRGIGGAVTVYASENDSKYPHADDNAWDVPMIPYLSGNPEQANPMMRCPADKRPLVVDGGRFSRSYSLNANLPPRAIQTEQPATTILLAEWYTGESGPGGASANFQFSPEYGVVEYHLAGLPGQYHRKVSNFVFCDGHAESRDPESTIFPNSLWTAR